MERVGQTGRGYSVERTLQEKQHSPSSVYLATYAPFHSAVEED